ncbi:hypothetical protein BB560_000447 [Smittium megazygosporum]|uniref:Ribosomal protein bL31m N-terminal domain-containing protein n=1 Tax=Smittium megazygosporum TaxID=133381 RepID=A0A2T9ZKE6_9FUNG|nr:hypothetical protein BB560_000447 [Smittium megazygosporum]
MKPSNLLQRIKPMSKIWRPRSADYDKLKVPVFNPAPEIFYQRVVLSDGSTFLVKSTSPRAVVKLSKDTKNHPLWNPKMKRNLSDEGGILSKFTSKFGDLDYEDI